MQERENGSALITTGTFENALFILDRYEKQFSACVAATKTRAMWNVELWHSRFRHADYGSLMLL